MEKDLKSKRHTAAEGELLKVNVTGCQNDCGAVYLGPSVATKTPAAEGWYDSISDLRFALESDSTLDPVIRVSHSGNRRKTCPSCKFI
jgi:hypothetical protein